MSLFFLLCALILAFFLRAISCQLLLLSLLFIVSFLKGELVAVGKSFRYFWPLLLFTMLIHLFLRFESPWIQPLTTWPLWEKSLFFALRNGLILYVMTMIYGDLQGLMLMQRLEKWELEARYQGNGRRSALIQPLLIGWRYFGLMRQEFQTLQQLHRILGMGRKKGLFFQTKYYGTMVLPLILMSLSRAELLSTAMTTRGYNSGAREKS